MTKFESVFAQAMELDPDERDLLIIRLTLESDEGKEPGYDEAWSAEIKRRLDEIDQGEADLMDWEDFRKELHISKP
jgi:putative addiction module component (TIGR02574 family)